MDVLNIAFCNDDYIVLHTVHILPTVKLYSMLSPQERWKSARRLQDVPFEPLLSESAYH